MIVENFRENNKKKLAWTSREKHLITIMVRVLKGFTYAEKKHRRRSREDIRRNPWELSNGNLRKTLARITGEGFPNEFQWFRW